MLNNSYKVFFINSELNTLCLLVSIFAAIIFKNSEFLNLKGVKDVKISVRIKLIIINVN